MLYEDRMAVSTPEGVTLELSLAGVGSRFVAATIDGSIQAALFIATILATSAFAVTATPFYAVLVVWGFLVIFGYDTLWETFASGRTPGKRLAGLRVVKASGAPVTFLSSAVRNLLRIIDFLPWAYLVGIITVLATEKNQRLGDLAAGTIVVRERRSKRAQAQDAAASWTGWTPSPAVSARVANEDVSTWDVSAVNAEEIAAVRQFLARRDSLTSPARMRVAAEMARRLRPKIVGPRESLGDELVLEAIVVAKSERG